MWIWALGKYRSSLTKYTYNVTRLTIESRDRMKVSYMIATRNRRDELLKTLNSCRCQTYEHKEVHVVDDGSTDGTYEAVRNEFPEVIITRNDPNRGSVVSRNQIFARVTGEVLIGFDDDSRFIDAFATAQIVERFRQEPDLGLLEFQDIGPEYPERIPSDSHLRLKGERHIASFGEGRYAVRRSVLEKVDGFVDFFWHSYEGPDLAIRIWDAGYRCVGWYAIIVWHEYSGTNRNEMRTHYFHARNELLSNLMRTPWLFILPLSLWRMFSQLRYSLRRGWWLIELRVWWDAFRMVPTALRHRQPVRIETFRRCLLLNRRWVSDSQAAWALGYSSYQKFKESPRQRQ